MLNLLNDISLCATLAAILGLLLGYFLAKESCNKQEYTDTNH